MSRMVKRDVLYGDCLYTYLSMRSEGYSSRSVCLSVTTLAASVSFYTCNQRYSRVFVRLFLDVNSWIFEKPSVEKAIC